MSSLAHVVGTGLNTMKTFKSQVVGKYKFEFPTKEEFISGMKVRREFMRSNSKYSQIMKLVNEEDVKEEVCPICNDKGTVEVGQYDNFVTTKCECQIGYEEDNRDR